MEITFAETSYNNSNDHALKTKLTEYFNRPKVNKTMEAVARHILPDPLQPYMVRSGYAPLSVPALAVFGITNEGSDHDPFNLCGAVISAAVSARKDASMSEDLRGKLQQIAEEMLQIADKGNKSSDLRNSILVSAKARGFIQARGVA